MSICNFCARRCGIDRSKHAGFCGMTETIRIARAGLHFWEEPCISGTKGSGTVFFSGCNLRCVYCQNYEISTGGSGQEITLPRLKEIYSELIAQGAHNINLVTPTHYTDAVLASLEDPLPVPVVYNTNGYEDVENLKRLDGKVQIYLPDLKYSDDSLAIRYSNAPGYFAAATRAIREMFRQTGRYRIDEETGLMERGIIIRHLLLPGQVENTKRVIDWVAETFDPGDVLFSLMRQYIPHGKAEEYPELNRKVTDEEYQAVEDHLFDSGIEDGFVQDEDSASKDFIPSFDGTGV
ncbi:MAG: radical SAM protein [Lentisphaerae bacterium]|nr:radical SAM protein [Lentisphaerota bacterium]